MAWRKNLGFNLTLMSQVGQYPKKLFDEMPDRYVVVGNMLISGLWEV